MEIKELKDGMSNIKFDCFVESATEKATKKGSPYVAIVFADAGGKIGSNIWDQSLNTWKWPKESVVTITGNISTFGGKLQIKLVKPLEVCNKPLNTFFKSSERDIHRMFEILTDVFINKIENPFIKFLAEELILEPKCAELYCAAPAAKTVHHNWIGGLLEHSLGLCTLATAAHREHYYSYFPTLDMDKVIFGCLFHDWGKIMEYDYSSPMITYAKKGCLMHHIGAVADIISRKSLRYEMKHGTTKYQELSQELLHIIYSHHGKQEWGSLVRPSSQEALYVHLVDYMDGMMMHMRENIKDGIEGDIPGMSIKSWAHQTQYLIPNKGE